MSELLKTYDSYHDFNRSAYFTFCFDTLPSDLSLSLPLEETKGNMEKVMKTIDFKTLDLQIIYKD